MKKAFILFLILAFVLVIMPKAVAQDCCPDLEICEELFDSSVELLNGAEAEIETLEMEIEILKTDPPDLPMNGALQSFAWYRKLPSWAKMGISGVITVGVLTATAYIETKK